MLIFVSRMEEEGGGVKWAEVGDKEEIERKKVMKKRERQIMRWVYYTLMYEVK